MLYKLLLMKRILIPILLVGIVVMLIGLYSELLSTRSSTVHGPGFNVLKENPQEKANSLMNAISAAYIIPESGIISENFTSANMLINCWRCDFEIDHSFLERLNKSNLTREESAKFSNRHILVLGDSLDSYLMGTMCSCPRDSGPDHKFSNATQCVEGKPHIDKCHFKNYDLRITIFRIFFGVYPYTTHHPMINDKYRKWFTRKSMPDSMPLKSRYKFLLNQFLSEASVELTKPDIVVINIFAWVKFRFAWYKNGKHDIVDNSNYAGDIAVNSRFLKSFHTNLSIWYDAVADKWPDAIMTAHTLTMTPAYPHGRDREHPAYIRAGNAVARSVASEKGAAMMDWENILSSFKPETYLRDGFHPNTQCYSIFATLFWAYAGAIFEIY